MKKVITYGTYDLFHYGHQRLLERAKELGDYLIVGVTADDFDKTRGKINVHQPLIERIESVRSTGLADEIIVEEYEGQKIDDIKRKEVDIFTVGSDWIGEFDYLNEFCDVVYLDRTEGISSSDIRSEHRSIKLGLIGKSRILTKFYNESKHVNGITVDYVCTEDPKEINKLKDEDVVITEDYDVLLEHCDAVYIVSPPIRHYEQIKKALNLGKHVLCEAPIALREDEFDELIELAEKNGLMLFESIKTAYSTAFHRLVLLAKSGRIGDIISIDATCTSLRDINTEALEKEWSSIEKWGPTALLPIFEIFGTEYKNKHASSLILKDNFDIFTKIDFEYESSVASIKVGNSVKSEGELIISGRNGYIYVPAPWWKTDYFELRYENQEENKKYFYQLEGEGIRYELVAFIRSIQMNKNNSYIKTKVSKAIAKTVGDCIYGDVNKLS
ncbi:MAG: Gfo/Idh/MocA family oxidoreductase [Methanobrevibacter sp.]|uniref:Gfo/Idh/MocA family oxidoreductase n=1 Tax=Methanobrevibacter sp. TaxID=66852 RepID=UPI0026DFDAAF|nr:Gfo/Idh/MocA family oxidoreductase [Methanobrevibacter sp.]MDO5848683.1 Gfo/Idh/MocA family oxidoreductase [Methanobrevibacter sp.]